MYADSTLKLLARETDRVRLREKERTAQPALLPSLTVPLVPVWQSRHFVGCKPRQQTVRHRELIDGGRYDDRRLLHIILDYTFISVEIGVPGMCTVLDRILLNSDARQSRLIEGSMIRPPELPTSARRGTAKSVLRKAASRHRT